MDGPINIESPGIAGGDWGSLAETLKKYTAKVISGIISPVLLSMRF